MSEYTRKLAANQIAHVHVWDLASGTQSVVHVNDEILLEAPNWASDGHLYLNGDGMLYRLAQDGTSELQQVSLPGIPHLNNDHVLAPDGRHIYLSTFDDFQIYRAPLAGGQPELVTDPSNGNLHFLHGVSPDDRFLAYVCLGFTEDGGQVPGHLRTLNRTNKVDQPLTHGPGPDDGPEYSQNGDWIYFNTERFSTIPGHAQIAKIRPDGSEMTQLTFDDRVNWFPHQSPDGKHWVYLSYPTGTEGHPADLVVQLRLVSGENWDEPCVLTEFAGGQGTINVNSWNPNSKRFAYVTYPFIEGES